MNNQFEALLYHIFSSNILSIIVPQNHDTINIGCVAFAEKATLKYNNFKKCVISMIEFLVDH